MVLVGCKNKALYNISPGIQAASYTHLSVQAVIPLYEASSLRMIMLLPPGNLEKDIVLSFMPKLPKLSFGPGYSGLRLPEIFLVIPKSCAIFVFE
jgi:hypothetical protein